MATPEQQAIVARYEFLGSRPEVFDARRTDWHARRIELLRRAGSRFGDGKLYVDEAAISCGAQEAAAASHSPSHHQQCLGAQ